MRANKGHGDSITEDNRAWFRGSTGRPTASIIGWSRAERKGSRSRSAMFTFRDV
jgi:hypothetical protein